MQIIVSGQHLEKFPQLEDYVLKKVKRLEKFYPRIEKVNVHLISEKSHRGQEHDYYCEIEVEIPGRNLEIVDSQRSMDKAIDKAVERLKRILTKTKERKISKWHKLGILNKLKSQI